MRGLSVPMFQPRDIATGRRSLPVVKVCRVFKPNERILVARNHDYAEERAVHISRGNRIHDPPETLFDGGFLALLRSR